MLKILLTLVLILGSFESFAADAVRAKQISDQLALLYTPSQSTAPNRAFLYKSNRNNVDDITLTEQLTISITPTQVVITRPVGDSTNLTTCSADYGTATANSSSITVNTTRLPMRVRCTNSDDSIRQFYTTYLAN